ncbi:amidohydrolase family protein [Streptomyces sp. NPDC053541]|uniref:amidohydrolase family protein n=1 Tax=Streptomyces sp. NPDC053541 TaxID=3365709 RepID=UPI0037D53246
MRTLVTASWVIAHDGRTHVELPDGGVLIDGDTVLDVGDRAALARTPVDRHVELGEAVLTPGLIDLDALTDIDHLILDSWAPPERADGYVWSEAYFDRPRAVFDAAQRRTVRTYALTQLALHGITSYMPIASEVHSDWAETHEDLVAMAEVSRSLGLRGFLGPSFRSGVNVIGADGEPTVKYDEEAGRRGLAEALRFLDHTEKLADPLVTGVLLPCRIETLTPELLRDIARAAERRGALVRLHALQGNAERAYVRRTHGMTPLQLLAETGLLSDRLIVPHGVVLDVHPDVLGTDTGDTAVLAEAGVSVVHCPLTNARYAHHLHTFGAYRERGVNLCLGTDSFPPDLIRGIDTGVQVAKLQAGDLGQGHLAGYFEALWTGGPAPPRPRPDRPRRRRRPHGLRARRLPHGRDRGPAAHPGPQRHRARRGPHHGRRPGRHARRADPRRRPRRAAARRAGAVRPDARGLPGAGPPPAAGGGTLPACLPARLTDRG